MGRALTEMMGELYLGELGWLTIHMRFQMFRLGRLQFRMWTAYRDMPEAGISGSMSYFGTFETESGLVLELRLGRSVFDGIFFSHTAKKAAICCA